MSKKKLTLTVRPEPPSFNEIEKDIKNAGDMDVIFLSSNDDECSMNKDSRGDSNKLTQVLNQKTSATDTGSTVNDNSQPDIDAVYSEAIEFINLAEEIKKSPEGLRLLHERLRNACCELSSSIDLLRQQANEVQGLVKKDTS